MTRTVQVICSITPVRAAALVVISLLGAACGGSSGDSGNGSSDRPPTASAGADQTATEKTSVNLTGSGGGSSTPLAYSWVQVSGADAGTISNANQASASFSAPDIVSGSDALTFRLTVTDSTGRSASDDITITVNDIAPSAAAGSDQSVSELVVVNLAGSVGGSDTPLAPAWNQVSGPAVTISNADTLTPSFTTPDVGASPEVVVLRLAVTDSTGRTASDDVSISVSEIPTTSSVFGKLEYEDPAHNAGCDGINFNLLTRRPIRGATVQLIDSGLQLVVQSTVSDSNGDYAFSNVDPQTSVFVRVRAELKQQGVPSWDVEVRDNTSSTSLPLASRPLYVLDGPASAPGAANDQRDMLAATGWTGSGFGATRAAAPFSILDTIYSAVQLVLSADANARFSPLDAFWSVNNSSVPGDIDIGELGTSFYRGDINSLFLLGLEGDDIEEFDVHVIAHEWGHYFEDNFSRSDSIGGAHGSNDRLDPRVAFGEGFATALSGMILDSDTYCDAFWFGGNLRGFDIDLESEFTGTSAGWFNENSIMKILYDLWDSDDDGADNASIGFDPIFTVFGGPQATTTAFTSIFSFGEAMKNAGTGQDAFIDAMLTAESVTATNIDRWASTESNTANSGNSLPVYTTVIPNGTPVNICSSGEFDAIGPGATGNKLNTHRYLRVDLPVASRYTFDFQADANTLAALGPDDPTDDRDQSDPDMYYFRSGAIQNLQIGGDVEGTSGIANSENFTSFNILPPGTYVIDFLDWRYEDDQTDPNYPVTTCFDVTVSPSP